MTKKNEKNFTAEEKLEAINKQFSFSEAEFGEFLRSRGILASDVELWKAEILDGLKPVTRSPGRPKKDPEAHRTSKRK